MPSSAQSIDVVVPIGANALMLVISDMHPWPDSDADARFGQFTAKLESYAQYVADARFESQHPGVSPAKVVISVVTLVPPSPRMRQLRAIDCKKGGTNISIAISYADEETAAPNQATASPAEADRLTARATAKRRLLTLGWIIAGIGTVTLLGAQIASPLQPQGTVTETIMSVCFWAGALTLVVGFGMVLWSQQDW